MKKLIPILILTLILLFSSLALAILTNGYIDVTVLEAKTMIDSDPFLVVLDVRTQSEYENDGHIRNAKLIPVTELSARLGELNKTDEILVYCKLGGRSASASQILVDNGFMYVYNMLGGIIAWKTEKYPVYVKYSSLQKAVNTANEGTPIYVSSGTYYENVLVNKTLSLIGENSETTFIDGSGTGTVVQVVSDDVTINDFTVQNGGTIWPGSSIWLSNSHNSIISDNKIKNNYWYGIGLNYSNFVTVDGNIVTNNDRGIWIVHSNNCTVKANDAFKNLRGIWLQYSAFCLVTGNTANNNTYDGIVLYNECDGNIVHGNTVISNNGSGIKLENIEVGSIVQENTLVRNNIGIGLYSTQGNVIYHNNLLENTQQLYQSGYNNNTWDKGYPSPSNYQGPYYGNYWSDYGGDDNCYGPNQDLIGSDGIGDTPYIIGENNVDRYPLMYPYGSETPGRGAGGSSKKSRR